MSYYFMALTMYWGWSFYDRPTWWRLTIAVIMGFCAVVCCARDVGREREIERMRWDD